MIAARCTISDERRREVATAIAGEQPEETCGEYWLLAYETAGEYRGVERGPRSLIAFTLQRIKWRRLDQLRARIGRSDRTFSVRKRRLMQVWGGTRGVVQVDPRPLPGAGLEARDAHERLVERLSGAKVRRAAEVTGLLARGKSVKQIAAALRCPSHKVEWVVRNLQAAGRVSERSCGQGRSRRARCRPARRPPGTAGRPAA